MPLHEYECEACGNRFETIQKFSDAPLEQCPRCGGKVRKLISAPAFQFKGSGWYITDYARKDAGSKDDGSSKAKAGTDEKAEKPDKPRTTAEKSASASPETTSPAKDSKDSGTK